MKLTSSINFDPAQFPQICVVGNLLTDLIIRGIPELPQWGQEVAGEEHGSYPAGQAVNLAQTLGNLGCRVRVIGNVGSDAAGKLILESLGRYNVDITGVEISPGASGLTVAIVRPDGERAFVSDFASLRLFDRKMANRLLVNDASQVICLVGLFNLPSFTINDAFHLFSQAHYEKKLTVLDTGWDPDQWPQASIDGVRQLLSKTDIFLPNQDEATVLTGLPHVQDAAAALLALGPSIVVVKCGPNGAVGCQVGEIIRAPALEVLVYDAVGAGDVFNAGFLLGFLPAHDLKSGLALGNKCAGLYISKKTNRIPSPEEVFSQSI